ncbi:MAG: hypothetical protein AB1755_01650 [Candidatus Omnitrophota bacterium]
MKPKLLFNFILFFLFLTTVCFSAYETKVSVYKGMVGVQAIKDKEAYGKEKVVTSGEGVNIKESGDIIRTKADKLEEADSSWVSQARLEESRQPLVMEGIDEQTDRCEIINKFLQLISQGNPRALDMLCEEFSYTFGQTNYSKAEFARYLEDAFRMSNNRTINLIPPCRKVGDCLSVDVENIIFLGQTQWRSRRDKIIICFSKDNKICSVRGELIVFLPNLNNEVTIASGDVYNAETVTVPFTVSSEAKPGTVNLVSGTITLRYTANTDSFDFDTQTIKYNTTSQGDFYFGVLGAPTTVGAARITAAPVADAYASICNAGQYTITATADGALPADDSRFVFKTNGGRYAKIRIISSVAGTRFTFEYVVNPAIGDTDLCAD